MEGDEADVGEGVEDVHVSIFFFFFSFLFLGDGSLPIIMLMEWLTDSLTLGFF